MENVCTGETTDSCRDFNRTVYIDLHTDCPADAETGEDVKQFLCKNGVNVWDGDVPGKTYLQNFNTALKQCKWCVYVISSSALHKEDSKFFMFRWRIALQESVIQNEVRVIPILDDLDEEDIPNELSAVTYLRKQETNYLEKLLKIIKCKIFSSHLSTLTVYSTCYFDFGIILTRKGNTPDIASE